MAGAPGDEYAFAGAARGDRGDGGYRDTSVPLRNAYKVKRVEDMEEVLHFALLGTQIVLILILIVIAQR